MSSLRLLPRSYFLFALVLLVGFPDAMLINGQRIEHFDRGLALALFLLWRLARRGYITWALLLAWNTFVAVSIIGVGGGPSTWGAGAPALLACALASVTLLLWPSMREHVGLRDALRRRISSA